MEEIWKDIKGYEGVYQVSNFGRVKRVTTGRILKGTTDKDGYALVLLSKNNTQSMRITHRLVAQNFIPNDGDKFEVNHIDENKTNNRVDNLEWSTRKENCNHGTRNERISKAKSIPIISTNIKTGEVKEFSSGIECARQLNLTSGNISAALTGRLKQTGGYTLQYKEAK